MAEIKQNVRYSTYARSLPGGRIDHEAGDIVVRAVVRLSKYSWLVEDMTNGRGRMVRAETQLRDLN